MFKQNLIANYIGQAWVSLMGIAFVPIYINYIGIEGYGLIGFYGVMFAWLGLLDLGMSPTLNREMARFKSGEESEQSIRNLLRTIEIVIVLVAVFIGLLIFLGSDFVTKSWLKTEGLTHEQVVNAISFMGLVIALRFIEAIYKSCIIGLQRQVILNLIYIAMATLRGLGVVGVLAWVSPTVEAFFIWQALISVFTIIILMNVTYSNFPNPSIFGKFSLTEVRRIGKFATGITAIAFLSIILTQGDKIILSSLYSLQEFAYYSLATTVSGSTFYLIGPIIQSVYPRLCELQSKGNENGVIELFHLGSQLISVIPGSFAILIYHFSDIFLFLWTRDAELVNKVAPLLSLLALGALINTQIHIPYQTQLAYGWTGLAIGVNVIAVLFFIPSLWLVIPKYGASGAAILVIILNLGYVSFWTHLMHHKILKRQKWRWYIHDMIIPLLSAFIGCSIMRAFAPETLSYFVNLAFFFLASLVTMSIGLLAAKDFRFIIGSKIKKLIYTTRT